MNLRIICLLSFLFSSCFLINSFSVTITSSSSNKNSNYAKIGDNITFNFVASEDVMVNGTVLNGQFQASFATSFSVVYTIKSSDTLEGLINATVTIENRGGQQSSQTINTNIIYDRTAPVIQFSHISVDSCNSSYEQLIEFNVTASENVTLSDSAFSKNVLCFPVYGTSFTCAYLSVDDYDPDWSIESGVFYDAAGNTNAPSRSYTLNLEQFPTISQITVFEGSFAENYDLVLGVDDTIVLSFDRDTNVAGACNCSLGVCSNKIYTPAEIDNFFTFSRPIAANYRGLWVDCTTFLIRIVEGYDIPAADVYDIGIWAVDKGNNSVCGERLRVANNRSPPSNQSTVNKPLLGSDIGRCSGTIEGKKCICRNTQIKYDCSVPCYQNNSISGPSTDGTPDKTYHLDGQCVCKSGFFKDDCSFECVENQGIYYSSSESCLCLPLGYVGSNCGESCGPGYEVTGNLTHGVCTKCSPGTYSNSNANQDCTQCEVGKYQPNNGSSSCLSCPSGTTSLLGSSGLDDCTPVEGKFRTLQKFPEFKVVPCPIPSHCSYWGSVDRWNGGELKSENITHDMEWCLNKDQSDSCIQCRCDEKNSSIPEERKECYTGYLCIRCHSGYYSSGATCVRCPDEIDGETTGLVIALAVLLVLVYKAAPFGDAVASASSYLTFFQFISFYQYFSLPLPTVLREFMAAITFFSFKFQIVKPECQGDNFKKFEQRFTSMMIFPPSVIGVFVFALGLHLGYKYLKYTYFYERERKRIQATKNLFNEIDGGEGEGQGEGQGQGEQKVVRELKRTTSLRSQLLKNRTSVHLRRLSVASPTDEIIEPVLQQRVKKYFEKTRTHEKGRRGTRFAQLLNAASISDDPRDPINMNYSINLCFNGVLTFLSWVYILLVLEVLNVFSCEYHEDLGEYRMKAQPTITCFKSIEPWNSMAVGASFGLLVYVVGIPGLFAYILIAKRKDLESWESKCKYGFLYQRYARRWFWWELVLLGKKLLFVFLQLFTGSNPLFSMSACLMVLFFVAAYHMFALPFASNQLNRLEGLLLVGNFLILLLMAQLVDSNFASDYGEAIGISIIVITVITAVIGFEVTYIEVRRQIIDLNRSRFSSNGKLGRWLAKEKEKRFALVKSITEMSRAFLDPSTFSTNVTWMRHHASYSELQLWAQFLNTFEEFKKKLNGNELENVPRVNNDLNSVFWLWMSKSPEHQIVQFVRSLTHIRLFKRWQQDNEKRVAGFIVDLLKEEVFLNRDTSKLSPSQVRWARLRHQIFGGKWRSLDITKIFVPVARRLLPAGASNEKTENGVESNEGANEELLKAIGGNSEFELQEMGTKSPEGFKLRTETDVTPR